MRRIVILILILPTFSLINAIMPPADKELVLESTGSCNILLPLGTTVNDFLVVFYDHEVKNFREIKNRVVSPKGKLKRARALAPKVDVDCAGEWDVVWHPEVKRFLLAYHYDDTLYVCIVNSKGRRKGDISAVCKYTGKYVHVAWLSSKRFVVFIYCNDQMAAILLDRNGKIIGVEKQLTNYAAGEVYPLCAVSEENGLAVAYFVNVDQKAGKNKLGIVKVDKSLKILMKVELAETQPQFFFDGAAYDPASGVHMVGWSAVLTQPKYRSFDKNFEALTPVRDMPSGIFPLGLVYDPAGKRFTSFYMVIELQGSQPDFKFYLWSYDPEKLSFGTKKQLKNVDMTAQTYSVGFSRIGSRFCGWSVMKNPGGIRGLFMK